MVRIKCIRSLSSARLSLSVVFKFFALLLQFRFRHSQGGCGFLLVGLLDFCLFRFLLLGGVFHVMQLLLLLDAGCASPFQSGIAKAGFLTAGYSYVCSTG